MLTCQGEAPCEKHDVNESPTRATDAVLGPSMSTIRWRSWSREAIPDERTLKSVTVMAEYLLPAKLRKDPSAKGVEGKHMQIQ